MSNPYNRILTILTYIEGELVNAWKESQLKKLNERVTAGVAETDEAHWNLFEKDFNTAFTNTNDKEEAYQALTRLKQGPDLDSFIARFKELVDRADVDPDNRGTIEIFKHALSHGLIRAVIGSPNFKPLSPWGTLDEWIKEAQEQHIKYKHSLPFRPSSNQVRQGLYQALKYKKNGGQGRRTTSQGGDAMDIDSARTSNLTEDQKATLMKENKCFYCQHKGHRAADCFKKKHDQGQSSSTSAAKATSETASTTSEIPDLRNFNMGQLAETIRTYAHQFDDDTKLGLVEKLLPKDFGMGPN